MCAQNDKFLQFHSKFNLLVVVCFDIPNFFYNKNSIQSVMHFISGSQYEPLSHIFLSKPLKGHQTDR